MSAHLPAPVQQSRSDVEPVAWSRASFIEDDDGRQIGTDKPEISWSKEPPDEFSWSPLYTTPPAAKRPWFELTDEEMYLNCPNWLSQEQCKVWIQQIEAKLKEKNSD